MKDATHRGADVDDPATVVALDHVFGHEPCAEENAEQVDIEDAGESAVSMFMTRMFG
jgi:hypothetical protein